MMIDSTHPYVWLNRSQLSVSLISTNIKIKAKLIYIYSLYVYFLNSSHTRMLQQISGQLIFIEKSTRCTKSMYVNWIFIDVSWNSKSLYHCLFTHYQIEIPYIINPVFESCAWSHTEKVLVTLYKIEHGHIKVCVILAAAKCDFNQ